MNKRSTSRMPGKIVALGFGVIMALVFIAALVTWYLRKDPHGSILAQAPLDGRDLILLRRGYEERGYIHLVRWNLEEERKIWSEALFGVEEDPALTISENVILVRAREARGHAEIHAFDHQGNFLWRAARSTYEKPQGNSRFFVASTLDS